MKTNVVINILVLVGAVLYTGLFRHQEAGVNIGMFTLFIIGGYAWIYRGQGISTPATMAIIGLLITGIMVVVHHSIISLVAWWFSLFLTVGFVHAPKLRLTLFSGMTGVLQAVTVFPYFFQLFQTKGKGTGQVKAVWRMTKMLVLPILAFYIFYNLYASANQAFADATNRVFSFLKFDHWITNLELDVGLLIFFLTGCFLMAMLFAKPQKAYLEDLDEQMKDTLTRNRKGFSFGKLFGFKMNSLRTEYRIALMVMGSLNVLLFFVNVIDVWSVWFGATPDAPEQLSRFVHEGTYILIFSILLSMSIVLFFFRKNLNFFPGNTWLKTVALVWIVQNILLVVSVGVRNFHYIDQYGLAYKRIGVVVFLLLTVGGLVSLAQKVRDQKSIYYLLRVNGWLFYGMFVLLSLINWDMAITRYNLSANTVQRVDLHFLLYDVSDKNIPLLLEHRAQHGELESILNDRLNWKVQRFYKAQQRHGWPSWNLADYRTSTYLTKHPELIQEWTPGSR